VGEGPLMPCESRSRADMRPARFGWLVLQLQLDRPPRGLGLPDEHVWFVGRTRRVTELPQHSWSSFPDGGMNAIDSKLIDRPRMEMIVRRSRGRRHFPRRRFRKSESMARISPGRKQHVWPWSHPRLGKWWPRFQRVFESFPHVAFHGQQSWIETLDWLVQSWPKLCLWAVTEVIAVNMITGPGCWPPPEDSDVEIRFHGSA
jgi:hypothetical protein